MVYQMSFRLCLFLFICLLGSQLGCQTRQATENTSDCIYEQTAETDVSDEKIRLLFIESGLGEGDGKLEELMTFPKEKIVAAVQKIKVRGVAKGEEGYQTEYHSEYMKTKSAYFLRKLGVDAAENEKYIVEATKNKDFSLKFDALSYLEIFISEGRKEYLPIVFEAAPEADGGAGMEMQLLLVYELEKSPKIFLDYLSKEPLRNRKSVYDLVSYSDEMVGRGTLKKIKANVGKLKADKNLKIIAAEFLSEISKQR